jgi:hypothetical protein
MKVRVVERAVQRVPPRKALVKDSAVGGERVLPELGHAEHAPKARPPPSSRTNCLPRVEIAVTAHVAPEHVAPEHV